MQQAHPFAAARTAAISNTLPPNARLLVQVGAGDGALARHYHRSYPTTSLVVVEADAAAAQRATSFAERVVQVQLESAGSAFYRHLQWADAWLFDGTLERLAEPARVLAGIRTVLNYDACVLACVSNPAAAEAEAPHPLDLAALQNLFTEAGFRLPSTIAISPGGTDTPSHFLIKAMPA
ncbi:hypothetical protein GTP41_19575 [Pseudoduganella sp. DS3]|uniref:Class I SAM-dependent methyltransferase n=1 Tax=Pseudoduganella guangdongensis TaxID=2692179 RepID=A0A6N9HLQ5_9BURK|nr:hypothetical protein [Pseudoduganella guangdongensis]MYN04296.1 hypothetical protein [Pseudoduganella guangdongensis]